MRHVYILTKNWGFDQKVETPKKFRALRARSVRMTLCVCGIIDSDLISIQQGNSVGKNGENRADDFENLVKGKDRHNNNNYIQ